MNTKNQSPMPIVSLIITVILVELLFWFGAYLVHQYIHTSAHNFRFENKWILTHGWPIIPALIVIYCYIQLWRNNVLKKLNKNNEFDLLIQKFSASKLNIKYTLWRLSLALLLIAAANPQFGTATRELETKGIEIMIALDISNSMLAEDLSPNYNRLKIAKMAIEKLIDKLNGDHIGIVVFAGSAYKQLPITPDYSSAKMFLQNIHPEMISAQGTDIGNAIYTCLSSFNFENGINKAIILISDGEDHEQAALTAANEALEKGVIIHAIGMGSELGVPIPHIVNGKKQGNKKDQQGNTVLTKINEKMLIDIASAGGGSYTRANGMSVGLDGLLNQINTSEKTNLNTDIYTSYDSKFSLFLIFGFFFILLDLLILEKINPSHFFSKYLKL